LESLTKLKPAPLYKPKNTELITGCTYENDLAKLKDVDWVLEAVAEREDIKKSVYTSMAPHLKKGVIVSSNTSGIPLSVLAEFLPENVRKNFLITHFFNPPRYMQLLELVRGEKTSDEAYDTIVDIGRNVLGKGIVHGKDTPNFIGNRIGVFGMMVTISTALKMGLTVEEVDKITGTIVGRPKSATFRTADVVGLDTLANVAKTSYERGENDEEKEVFNIPPVLAQLIESGRLGQKTKAGFYKKEGKTILSLNMQTGEYVPQKKVLFDGFRLAKDHQKAGHKIKAMAFSDDKAGKFFWEVLSRTLIYSANRIPEISDDIVNVDNAMKWGFGWEMGPFETWDAIGVQNSITRMQDEGKTVPKWVLDMLASGRKSFYTIEEGEKTFYNSIESKVETVAADPKEINLILEKAKGNLVKRDWSASLIDLGDGVLDLEFHSILQPFLNPLDMSILDMLSLGLDLVAEGKYKGLVVGHQGPNFCAGANLAGILQLCEGGDFKLLDQTVKVFQDLTQRIRFSPAPVVAAPFQLTLGGGFEFTAPAAHRVIAAETYIGAVEVGVGLIPGAGGNLRMIQNLMENSGKTGRLNIFGVIQKAFETIGFAKIATSADEAKHLGYFKKTDTVVLNRTHQIFTAKQKVLELADGYTPPEYMDKIKLPGAGGRTAITTVIKGLKRQGKLSEHDEKIGLKLAYVLTGGSKAGLTSTVDEQYLLDIEREAFVELGAEPLSQDRIRFMLKKGKPLRN